MTSAMRGFYGNTHDMLSSVPPKGTGKNRPLIHVKPKPGKELCLAASVGMRER